MKILLLILFVALLIMIVLFMYACIKIAGMCSKREEEHEKQIHKNIQKESDKF